MKRVSLNDIIYKRPLMNEDMVDHPKVFKEKTDKNKRLNEGDKFSDEDKDFILGETKSAVKEFNRFLGVMNRILGSDIPNNASLLKDYRDFEQTLRNLMKKYPHLSGNS